MKNKRIFKAVLSLFMAVVTVVSVFSATLMNASAASEKQTSYDFVISTAGSDGITSGELEITLYGRYGMHTVHMSYGGLLSGEHKSSYLGKDIGQIFYIKVVNDTWFGDDWYPEYIKVSSGSSESRTFYCGCWCNEESRTFNEGDRVAVMTVNTGNISGAGTDCDVYATLKDEKGLATEEVNLSSISKAVNAFEKNDVSKFYIKLPENFGIVKEITFRTNGNKIEAKTGSWHLESLDICVMSGDGSGDKAGKTVYVEEWINSNTSYTVKVC